MSGAGPQRLAGLDALRGLAALFVLTFHLWKLGILGPLGPLQWTPLNLLISGRPPVILFFVLSGFVLAAALERASAPGWRDFVLRRLARIWLPFAASIGLSVLLYLVVRPAPVAGLSRWFNGLGWVVPPGAGMLAQHLLMSGLEGQDSLNPVMWTLVYELRISLVFPLLFLAGYRFPLATLGGAVLAHGLAAVAVGCAGPECQPYRGGTLAESAVLTGYFALFFVLGILAARFRHALRGRLRAAPAPVRALVGLAALAALILPNVPPLMRFLPADLAFGLGAAALILLAIAGGAWQRALEHPGLGWLGRVSYSLYLTHNIVLLALVHLLFGALPGWALLAVVALAALLVAEAFYRLVEAPSIRLSHRLRPATGLRPAVAGGG